MNERHDGMQTCGEKDKCGHQLMGFKHRAHQRTRARRDRWQREEIEVAKAVQADHRQTEPDRREDQQIQPPMHRLGEELDHAAADARQTRALRYAPPDAHGRQEPDENAERDMRRYCVDAQRSARKLVDQVRADPLRDDEEGYQPVKHDRARYRNALLRCRQPSLGCSPPRIKCQRLKMRCATRIAYIAVDA